MSHNYCLYCNKGSEGLFCDDNCNTLWKKNKELKENKQMKEGIDTAMKLKKKEFEPEGVSTALEQASPEDLELIDQMEEEKSMTKYEYSEKQDEMQIVQEYQGIVIDQYFYNYQGKKSISYAGIKAIVTQMGNFNILSHEFEQDEDFFYCTVKIRDTRRNLDGLGISEQSKTEKLKNGTVRRDEFARRKALSKALRNAYRSIIDEAYILDMYKRWKK